MEPKQQLLELGVALILGLSQGWRLGPERRSSNGDDCHANGGEALSISH